MNKIELAKDHQFEQTTDRYPMLYKKLEKLLKREHLRTQILKITYFPVPYLEKIHYEQKMPVNIFNLFQTGFLKSFFAFSKTFYYDYHFKQLKLSPLKIYIKLFKFYRFFYYVKLYGLNLQEILEEYPLRTFQEHIGKKLCIPVDLILSEKEFKIYDENILKNFDQNRSIFSPAILKTDYYLIQRTKRKKSFFKTLKHINKYRKLFISIKIKGYHVSNPDNLKLFPWLFYSSEVQIRLDGHHRCGAARFLNYEHIPVLVVTPKDILSIPDLPGDILKYMKDFTTPEQIPFTTFHS